MAVTFSAASFKVPATSKFNSELFNNTFASLAFVPSSLTTIGILISISFAASITP